MGDHSEGLFMEGDEFERMRLEDNDEGEERGVPPELCLVGRFVTERNINFLAMKARMEMVWRPGRGMIVQKLGANLFLFQFNHLVDVKRIMDGGPWFFDYHLLALKQLSTGDNPLELDLNMVPFWIRVYDIPMGYMRESVGKLLGDFVGRFIAYDKTNDNGAWRTYMRLRVELDVRLPLKRWKKIGVGASEEKFVSFKYERVGLFCYVCGVMGHAEKFCPKRFEIEEAAIRMDWGRWLEVANRRNNMGRVGGDGRTADDFDGSRSSGSSDRRRNVRENDPQRDFRPSADVNTGEDRGEQTGDMQNPEFPFPAMQRGGGSMHVENQLGTGQSELSGQALIQAELGCKFQTDRGLNGERRKRARAETSGGPDSSNVLPNAIAISTLGAGLVDSMGIDVQSEAVGPDVRACRAP